jgi:hypothetical protein
MRGVAVLAAGLMLAASLPAMAAADPMAAFARSCQTQMFMSAAACACMVQKARAELDGKELTYLSIPGANGPAAARAAEGMSRSELARVDHFMRTAPEQCQKRQ